MPLTFLYCLCTNLYPTILPKHTGVGSLSLLQLIFPTGGIEPWSPALQVDSLPTELSGKPQLC